MRTKRWKPDHQPLLNAFGDGDSKANPAQRSTGRVTDYPMPADFRLLTLAELLRIDAAAEGSATDLRLRQDAASVAETTSAATNWVFSILGEVTMTRKNRQRPMTTATPQAPVIYHDSLLRTLLVVKHGGQLWLVPRRPGGWSGRQQLVMTDTAKHVELVCARVGKLVDDCKAEHIADLTDAAVMAAIGTMRTKRVSLQTCNHYICGIKQFSRWLKLQKRTPDDALAALAGFNAETDRRYVRREMTPDEVAYLLRTVETYTTAMHNLPGPDRAMAYRVALGTGFRAKELRSLSAASFDLDADPPTVTVDAAYSKRRRLDVATHPARLG